METLQAIALRKSTRAFKSDHVPEDDVNAIVKAGHAAPVAMADYEAYRLTIVENKELLTEIGSRVSALLKDMTGEERNGDFGAPTMIVVSGKPTKLKGMDYASAACILENMLIAATDLGIDSIVWACSALAIQKSRSLSRRLGIPEGYKPLLAASFGYAKEEEAPKKHFIPANRIDIGDEVK